MFKSSLQTLFLMTMPTIAFPTFAMDLCVKHYQQQNFEEALIHCTTAAEQNNAHAQNILGLLYQHGQGVDTDYENALTWFEKAAKSGDLNAQMNTGKMYSKGWNWLSRPDYTKGFQYFSQAANQNHPEAQFIVALCYQNGLGVTQDETQALYWYHQAVNHGLQGGKVLHQTILRTAKVNDLSAHPGNKAYVQAQALKNKPGQTPKYLDALTLAAEKEHPQAQYELALRYLSGSEFSLSDEMALYWIEKAAQQNHMAAQTYLAWMTMLGMGENASLQRATQLFISARTQPESSVTAGNLSELNKVVATLTPTQPKQILNHTQALKLFRQGKELIDRNYGKQDQQKGLQLVHKATQFELPEAQLYLAQLYQSGKLVEKNRPLAAQLITKAAEQGFLEAQYMLGWLYYHGEGVYPDRQKAYELFHTASLAGDKRSLSAAKFVKSQLTHDQLAQLTSFSKARYASTL